MASEAHTSAGPLYSDWARQEIGKLTSDSDSVQHQPVSLWMHLKCATLRVFRDVSVIESIWISKALTSYHSRDPESQSFWRHPMLIEILTFPWNIYPNCACVKDIIEEHDAVGRAEVVLWISFLKDVSGTGASHTLGTYFQIIPVYSIPNLSPKYHIGIVPIEWGSIASSFVQPKLKLRKKHLFNVWKLTKCIDRLGWFWTHARPWTKIAITTSKYNQPHKPTKHLLNVRGTN